MKEHWEVFKIRCRCFCTYIRRAWRRWTMPRAYVIQYAYVDKDEVEHFDSHLVRAINLDVHSAMQYLRTHVDGVGFLRILGIQEVDADMYMAPVIDITKKLVDKIDTITNEMPQRLKDIREKEKAEEEDSIF